MMAEKNSLTILIVHIFIGVTGDFTFRCPPREQWSFRAKSTCPSLSYFCLLDLNFGIYKEQCRADASVESPGYKRVFAGDLHGIRCTHDRYQPFRFWTEESSNCVYLKSLCNDEGQVVHEDGKSDVDRKCRCDYRHGYDYVAKPRNTCYCIPSEEDCSCYRKYCSPGELLDPDYECRNTNNWKATFGCSPITTVPRVKETPPVLTVLTVVPTNDKTVSRPLVEIKILGCIVIFYIGLIFVICLLHERGEVDTKTKYVYIEVKQEVVPQNVKDFQVGTIEKWREQLKLFVATKASSSVATCLQSDQCVIITGPPGCGKTFTAYRVIMDMVEREHYDLLIIEDPNDVIRYSRQNKKQLIFVDDINGKYSLNEYNTGWWKHHEKHVRSLLSKNPNLRMLATSRSYIYNLHNANENKCMFFRHLSFLSDDKCLTIDEKRQIGKQYISEKIDNISDEAIDSYDFFPELCRLLTMESDDMNALQLAYRYIMEELNNLLNKSVDAFIILPLMFLSNNHLTEANLIAFSETNNDMNKYLLEELGINYPLVLQKRNLDALVGTYFVQKDGAYSFKTKHLFDVVSFCICKYIMKTILKYGLLEFLIEKLFCDETNGHIELKWFVTPPNSDPVSQDILKHSCTLLCSFESMYFDRMVDAIKSKQFLSVFMDRKNRSPKYRQRFLQYMMQGKRLTCRDIRDYPPLLKQLTGKPKRQSTPLHVVASLGHAEYFQFFVQLDVQKINEKDNEGKTPLHHAVLNNHASIVEYLVKIKAKINLEDDDGNTPLYLADREGLTQLAEILLKNKAVLNRINNI